MFALCYFCVVTLAEAVVSGLLTPNVLSYSVNEHKVQTASEAAVLADEYELTL